MRQQIILLIALLPVCAMGATHAAVSTQKPNILFIMADDHASQAIGSYGGRLAGLNPTPTIDTLARNGMRFDRVFCNNSICTPSRASILTGQYSQRNRVLDLRGKLPPAKQYLPRELKKAGYQTAMIGKWHLKAEPAAFDYYCVLAGQGSYYDPTFRIRGAEPWPGNQMRKEGMHSSDAITSLSLEWLQHGRDPQKPFFLMHHFKAPHDSFVNAKRYDGYLEDTVIPKPANLFAPLSASDGSRGLGSGLGKKAPWGLGKSLGIPGTLDGDAYVEACYQRYLKRYLRCVKGVDDNIQRLVDYLEASGELENTIIIYTSDQGFFLGEHDLMDKRWIYEESMRMPFIVHWPRGVAKGSTNNWLINNTDFAPTLLELAGLEVPDTMQGHSFSPALSGKEKPDDWRTVTYYRYWMHMAHKLAVPAHFGIRSDRYKLIFFYGRNKKGGGPVTPVAWEFYDLERDPHEMQNLYRDPSQQAIIARMKDQLKQTREVLAETDKGRPKIQQLIEKHWND